MLRATTATMYLSMQQNVTGALARFTAAQEAVASGKRVQNYSDDPIAAVGILRTASSKAAYADYGRAATDANAWLSAQDSALSDTTNLLSRAKDLAMSAINGAQDSTSLQAISSEMNQLRDQLASIANTNYQGSPVFGGFGTTAVQQTSPGVYSYVGGSGNVQRQVAPDTTMTVNIDGSQVFGYSAGAGKDVFSVLATLSNAAAAGDSATLTSALKDLNSVQDNVYTAQEQVGSKTQQVSALQSLLQSQTTDLEQVRSNLQDVDEAKSVLDLQSAQTAYQAALSAAAQGNLPSLASYLK